MSYRCPVFEITRDVSHVPFSISARFFTLSFIPIPDRLVSQVLDFAPLFPLGAVIGSVWLICLRLIGRRYRALGFSLYPPERFWGL